jgi:hypothetical protein
MGVDGAGIVDVIVDDDVVGDTVDDSGCWIACTVPAINTAAATAIH